jgi:hypothetical protein
MSALVKFLKEYIRWLLCGCEWLRVLKLRVLSTRTKACEVVGVEK